MLHYDTVIFDLDGTLLDTLEDLRDAVNYALAQKGFPTRTLDEIRRFVGNGSAKLIERSAPAGSSPEVLEELLNLYLPRYAEHKKDKTAPYPGIPDMLQALKAKGCKMAVVSNKFDLAVKGLVTDYFPGLMDTAA
ncbi:MAG: HAD hydrolase-like protein, partial [Oscillospiraceae bacterium]|nr:HAD hydrolase-like protein [Oscillospiraceae bacterium]